MTLLVREQDLIRQGKEAGREEAIRNMIRYGVQKEVILRDYSMEEYEKAEESLAAPTINT